MEEDAWVSSPYRYAGIRYADGGAPAIAATACHLWSLYDGYSGGTFEVAKYDANDNDDVSGYARRVFDKMDALSGNNLSLTSFNSSFKSGLSTEVQASVDKVYNFMFDNLTALPSSRPRPPQAKGLTAQKTSGGVKLQWAPQVYSGTPFYANRPTGYKVYRNSALVATLSPTVTSYTYSTSSPNAQYKVSAYNAAGDAANAPVVSITSPAPPAPTGFNITGNLGGHPQLSWNAVSGATGYKVYRCLNTSYTCTSFSQIASTSATSFTDYGKVIETDCFGSDNEIAQYHVRAYNGGGNSPPSSSDGVETCTDPSKGGITAGQIPTAFALHANYPNPFNPTTEIRFDLPEAAHVKLVVYDVVGREVARLASGPVEAGYRHVTFDASNLPNGVYLYRLEAGSFAQTKQMVLLK